MYAVIETGGKQLKVSEGETVLVEKLDGEVGSDFVFDKVMAVVDGDNTKIGTPYVDRAKSQQLSSSKTRTRRLSSSSIALRLTIVRRLVIVNLTPR